MASGKLINLTIHNLKNQDQALLFKKTFLQISQNLQENFNAGVPMTQGFSYEFCKIFKNTYV